MFYAALDGARHHRRRRGASARPIELVKGVPGSGPHSNTSLRAGRPYAGRSGGSDRDRRDPATIDLPHTAASPVVRLPRGKQARATGERRRGRDSLSYYVIPDLIEFAELQSHD
jgi:hypothetical protein